MTKAPKKRILSLFPIAALVTLILTGCVKARLEVEVKPNGSGTMSIAIGATEQIWALAGTSGESAMQALSQEASSDTADVDVTVRRWTEGSYEWVAASRPFSNPDELNALLSEVGGFETLSLTRKRNLIRDRFVLDGEIEPLAAGEEAPEDLLSDPGSMFEFQMLVKLPGKVTETNGVFSEDRGGLLWTLGTYEPLSIHAVSQKWNWSRAILIIALPGLAVFGLLILGLGVAYLARSKHDPGQSEKLSQGIAAIKEGRKKEGRDLLLAVLEADERNEQAWLWMSGAVETDQERRECLAKVLELDPGNERAAMGLAQLGPAKSPENSHSERPAVPRRTWLTLAAVLGAGILGSLGFGLVWWASTSGMIPSGLPLDRGVENPTAASLATQTPASSEMPTRTPTPAQLLPAVPTWTPTPTPDVRREITEYQSQLCPLMEEALNLEVKELEFWEHVDPDRFFTSPSYQQEVVDSHMALQRRFEECENDIEKLEAPAPLHEAHRFFVAHCSHFGKAMEESQTYLEERDPNADSTQHELEAALDAYERSLSDFDKLADELGQGLILPCPDLDLEEPLVDSDFPPPRHGTPPPPASTPDGTATPALQSAPEAVQSSGAAIVVDDWEVSVQRQLELPTDDN